MALVCFYGQMALHTMVNSRITISTARVITFGLIRGSTRETGLIIRCMVLGCSAGLMAEFIMVST